MKKRWLVGGCVTVAVAALAAWIVLSGSSENGYRDTVLGVAHDGLSAVRTTDLVAAADQQELVLAPYRSRAVDDAETGLADAVAELHSAEIPSAAAKASYDRLAPLMQAGVDAVAAARTAMADGRPELAAARDKLRTVGDGLADFIRSVR